MRSVTVFLVLVWLGTAGLPSLGYEGGEVEGGARLRGVVRMEGAPTRLEDREVYKHHEVCGATVPDDSLVLGPKKGVRYAVVSLEGVKRGRPIERDAVNVLDNRKCRFEPRVIAASVGQWLLLTNSDPILHSADAFHVEEKRTLFNVGLPPAKQIREPLARPGTVRMTCEVRHTWMQAWIVVADHPYITVTDLEGEFEMRDVPPGTYTLRVWHERLGTLERPVTVTKGETHVESFSFASGS